MVSRTLARLGLVAVLGFGVASCQKLSEPDQSPGPVAPVPVTPTPAPTGSVVVGTPRPSPTPTPSGTASPAPTGSPSPTTAPTATPGPGGSGCSLSPMPNCGSSCCGLGGELQFRAEIETAQVELRRTQPGLFNPDGSIAVEEVVYTAALARLITTLHGVCAVGGLTGSVSRDEIGVKRSNDLSQNVDVILSSGQPWVGTTYTCRPASF